MPPFGALLGRRLLRLSHYDQIGIVNKTHLLPQVCFKLVWTHPVIVSGNCRPESSLSDKLPISAVNFDTVLANFFPLQRALVALQTRAIA